MTIDPPVSTNPPADLAQAQQRRPRLLVVDDQPVNIQTLYQAFCADHQVLMATSGDAALQVCESQPPDLILLDVHMPGMDGYQLCARLKADARLRDIPVIFVTAHDDEAAETRGLDAGAVDFISKPINARIVRARVKTHLTLKAQSDLLRHWVYIDGLTGVHNRRHFDEQLAQEWGRAARQGAMLSVVLLDVDYFKRYNDRYGHLAGDECLRRIARTLKANIRRPGDLVSRYGGEEFAFILPSTDYEGAMHIAQQIGQAVRAQRIEHLDSSVSDVVTASLGVCSARASAAGSPTAMLEMADAQLYLAKEQGRDRAIGADLAAR